MQHVKLRCQGVMATLSTVNNSDRSAKRVIAAFVQRIRLLIAQTASTPSAFSSSPYRPSQWRIRSSQLLG